ncbi:MAG TPA: AAA family ATPase, partial [Parvularculaceae bacterium]|nr:AAA family ATPase [Parvularculaceae bacterium]
EPESHLHPTFQTRLVRALKDNAQRNGAVVLISTHSPFIVRGLPLNSRTVWLRDGYVKRSTLGEEIKQALGWGALDKSVLLCTEDKNVRMIEGLLGQTPSIFDKVSVVPFEGVSKLGTARLVTDLKRSLGDQHAVLVHRDRDCFSDEELTKWREEFINQGHSVWITQDTEVENYFCSKQYLEAIFDCDHNVASEIFDEAFSNNEPELKEKFTNKRKEINKAIYEKVGGSPKIEELWETLPKIHTISGKIFCSKLRAVAKKYGYDEKLIGRTPDNFSIAPDLISALIRILQQSEAITPTRHPKINL